MDPTVERQVELDAPADEVWDAVCQPASWLADEGELELRPGGEGRLVEDGVARRAVVETVEHGDEQRRLVYRWWDEHGGDGGPASRVEITVLPSAGSTRVIIREAPIVGPVACSRRAVPALESRWELRLLCLALLACGSMLPV
jgi:uncharacterized protein YndB with AHSA1/START domain